MLANAKMVMPNLAHYLQLFMWSLEVMLSKEGQRSYDDTLSG